MNIDLNALVDTYNIDNAYSDYKRLEFLLKLEKYVNLHESSILEFGPASGRFTLMLSKLVKEVVAVDGSSRFLEIAKKNVGDSSKVTFVHSLFEEFETSRTFDCLIFHHILEHITKPVELLAKVRTFLKDDGVLAISVPNAHALSRQLAVKMGLLDSIYSLTENDLSHGHVKVYDWNTAEEMIVSSGYEILGRHGLSLKLLSDKQNIEMLNAGIIAEQQIKGLWELGDDYYNISGAIMIVAKKRKLVNDN